MTMQSFLAALREKLPAVYLISVDDMNIPFPVPLKIGDQDCTEALGWVLSRTLRIGVCRDKVMVYWTPGLKEEKWEEALQELKRNHAFLR
jgi:hypothetical protein